MKHTPESLATMSDFEVNKALAELLGLQIAEEQHFNFGDRLESALFIGHPKDLSVVDYCNNPSDVMPLVFDNRISLIENDNGYTAYHNFSIFEDINYRIEHGAYFGDANPLRAAACCLILVLQEQMK